MMERWMVRVSATKYVYGFKSHAEALKYARKFGGTPMKDDGLR